MVEGSSHSISCEADGFPDPIVILSRLMKTSRQELSRGIKTTSFNLTANLIQEKESATFICETYNEGARLEKEFTILAHGQFPSLNSLVKVASNFGISLVSAELKFRAAS